MKIIRLSVILLCLLIAGPASAVTYKWVDDRGVVGFTEDLGTIPQKYRKKAGIVGEEEDATAPAVKETKESSRKKDAASDVTAPPRTSAEGVKRKTFGGKDEAAWSDEFAKARFELKSVREQMEAINARLANTSQMSRSEYKSLENSKKLLEEQESAARKRMDKLKETAGKAGVPQDLR